MKKYFLYTLFIISVVASCSKKDDNRVFDESPDERLNKVLTTYQSQLIGAENGWKAVITPAGGGAYSFYFKFNNANRVIMYSDFDSSTAAAAKESSYRLKATQQPSLLFDTYSYLHLLADPLPTVNGGAIGQGLLSDFEFYFESATADTIELVGKVNGNKMILTKATKQEADAFSNQQFLNSVLQLGNLNKIIFYFKRLTISGKSYDISINTNTKTVAFAWTDGSGNTKTFNTTYYHTSNGIVFSNPFNDGSQTITGFTNMNWNAGANTLSVSANNNSGTISGVNNPAAVDKEAPARWWNDAIADGGSYWISLDGFHVNDVDNAYRVDTLTSGANKYYYLFYWPAVTANNDVFGPFFLNAAGNDLVFIYGTAPRRPPTFTADGRAVFVRLGDYPPHPAIGGAALTRNQLYGTSGFYFVQTSPTSYDMVSATDSRIWITWER